jgi:hypothetical protein
MMRKLFLLLIVIILTWPSIVMGQIDQNMSIHLNDTCSKGTQIFVKSDINVMCQFIKECEYFLNSEYSKVKNNTIYITKGDSLIGSFLNYENEVNYKNEKDSVALFLKKTVNSYTYEFHIIFNYQKNVYSIVIDMKEESIDVSPNFENEMKYYQKSGILLLSDKKDCQLAVDDFNKSIKSWQIFSQRIISNW